MTPNVTLPTVVPQPAESSATQVGSYFISNYPPFSQWKRENVPQILAAFDQPPVAAVPLGMYLHIPFCRKRCRFCYFRVYTQQNADMVKNYVEALDHEVELLQQRPGIQGRTLDFVYFGGGTPSYLSSRQLLMLRDRLQDSFRWDQAREVTFECEPGTLSLEKVQTLKDIGVTRVSLGVENFNDAILEENGRAHLSPEIFRAYDWIRQVGFPQVNIDLIAGMIGETDENWQHCLERAKSLQPDNLTVYQMELPFNSLIAKEMSQTGIAAPVADWPTKRRWANEAFDFFLAEGYHISSGNELVRDPQADRFVYRDNLFRGSDILAVGVSSFGHFQGVHYQNVDAIEDYFQRVLPARQSAASESAVATMPKTATLPIHRALTPTPRQRLIREWVLQMKEGRVDVEPFRKKFLVDPLVEFAEALQNQAQAGFLIVDREKLVVELTRKGLLQVDSLLPEYFEPELRQVRYT